VKHVPHYELLRVAMMRECGALSCTVCSNSHVAEQKIVMLFGTVIRVKTRLNPPKFYFYMLSHSLLVFKDCCPKFCNVFFLSK